MFLDNIMSQFTSFCWDVVKEKIKCHESGGVRDIFSFGMHEMVFSWSFVELVEVGVFVDVGFGKEMWMRRSCGL